MSKRARATTIVVLTAVLWAVTTALGLAGLGHLGMYFALGLLLLYAVQGAARRGRVSRRFLAYPLLAWILCWAASFYLAGHYAELYSDRAPDFTVLGFHPSFAPTVLGYWIGGVLTLSAGFVLFRDDWLTERDWEEFKARVAADDEGGDP